ncbi:GGDEF domain-containing protein [Aquabacterium sp. A7-Y]|uniref:GGDEF domain-containing protein n=1 Tax=Aquabacterium sp. A7-Y TaxID=1349605 RepID=UPI00223DE5AC|nr:GGDEF domain-containing protein [Aquabacterium sp. A7-Y]MCW7537888.1 GGDEF domain-containing protein [Aquabacterium sp. A7-Y]
MTRVPIPSAATHVPPVHPEDADARARRRRGERVRMVGMVYASSALDTMLLVLFHFAGAVPLWVPLLYAAIGAAVCGTYYLALRSGFSERFRDPYLTGPQMVTASGLQLLTAVWAPQVGMLSLCMIFLVFAFSALRLTPRQLMPLWLLISAGIALVVAQASQPLGIPHETAWQALISALWMSLAVGRCAFVGLYGASVRQLLGSRNRELAEAQAQLHALAARDELTGALNRRAIMAEVRQALQHHAEGGPPAAVALLDLDHFKQVNDRHGHLVGDEVLRRFVLSAIGSLRHSDRLGRYGGEEFLLLIGAGASSDHAVQAAERLRAAVAGMPWTELAPNLAVTVSVGVAVGLDGETPEQLLQRADQALYRAKSSGRNCVQMAA